MDDRDAYSTFGRLSIVDVFDFIGRYFKLVIATTSATLFLALTYILTAVPLYTAAGQLLIDVRVPYLAHEQWREVGMVLDSPQIESQIAVLRSEPVALAVVSRLGLQSDAEFNTASSSSPQITAQPSNVSGAGAASAPEGAGVGKAEPDDEMVREMAARVQRGLGIRRIGYSYVLEISYTSSDPAKAARLANGFMQAYIDDQISTRTEAARQGSEWLEKRIETLRLQMNTASLKVQEFKARRDYSIMGKSSQVGRAAEGGDALQKGLTETLDELEATALTYRKMFESSLQAYTEVEQRQSYHASNARVIATASVPMDKSFPKRKEALAMALAAGLMLGLGIGLLRDGYFYARAAHARRDGTQV